MSIDPYKLLGVKKGDSLEAIKLSYRKLLAKYHPDHYPDKMDALYKSNLIIKAFKSIASEMEAIDFLKKNKKNSYRWIDKTLHLFLKTETRSFLTIFEPMNQIYEVSIKGEDIPENTPLALIEIHYFRKRENDSFSYRHVMLKKKMAVKGKRRIILKGEGGFRGDSNRNLVVFFKVI